MGHKKQKLKIQMLIFDLLYLLKYMDTLAENKTCHVKKNSINTDQKRDRIMEGENVQF